MGDNENRKVYKPRIVKNYREMIEYSVKNYADKVAYKYKKNGDLKHVEYVEKTYEQVGKDIKAFATELLNKGLEKKKIIVIGNNRYEWCISYLAVTSANMIIVPLDKALPDNEIENLVTRSEAEVAIFDKKYVEVMKKLKKDTKVNLKMLVCMDDIKDNEERYRKSMGTLGAGNHFISVEGNYLIIHCGSRNLGLRVANYYQDKAIAARDNRIQKIKENAEVIIKDAASNGDYMGIAGVRFVRDEKIKAEPENDLCYLEGEDMQDYLHDMNMMRDWSFYNHKVIAQEIFDGMGWHDFSDALMTNISSIHNYVDVEHSIIRKGAIDMSDGKLGIIPLNMASGSLLVRGKGNQDYLCSGPHGAGRIMSRKKARLSVDMDDYHKAMNGIYTTSVCYDTLDEAPQAYKDANAIIAAIEPTAEIIAHLRPCYNFKAKG